jgi:hypothetical protein
MKVKFIHSIVISGFILLFFSAAQNNVFAQARIVFGSASDAYMVMSSNALTGGNPIYLVVGDATGNAATNTITYTATKGGIISNGENNFLKWYIGTGSGSYTIPWVHSAGNYIPLTFNKVNTVAGQAGKFMKFATYRTPTYQNSAYMPAGVTNCNSAGFGDVSAYMVDRFWLIDNSDYPNGATLPDVQLTFSYVDGGAGTPEVQAASSSLVSGGATEAALQAEAYNNSSNLWAGSLYGTDNTATNQVGPTATIPATFLYKWWVLVEKNHPLPVTWLRQSAECNGGSIGIKWSTSSEQNSDYFTVEKSVDGINFTDVTHVIAAGNSSTVRNYSAIDLDPYSGVSYYRIRETDFNSSYMTSDVITVKGCSSDDVFVYGNEGGLSVNINATEDGQYNVELYDLLGQKVMNEVKNVVAGDNHLKFSVGNIASAVYVAKVYNSSNAVTKKVFIRSTYTQ